MRSSCSYMVAGMLFFQKTRKCRKSSNTNVFQAFKNASCSLVVVASPAVVASPINSYTALFYYRGLKEWVHEKLPYGHLPHCPKPL